MRGLGLYVPVLQAAVYLLTKLESNLPVYEAVSTSRHPLFETPWEDYGDWGHHGEMTGYEIEDTTVPLVVHRYGGSGTNYAARSPALRNCD